MKVTFIQNGIVYANNNTKSITKPKTDINKPSDKSTTNGLLLLGAGVVVSGAYLVKHKKVKLPDEPIANSLPQDIKDLLSYGNKYKKFKSFISNPEDKYIAGVGANSTVYNIPETDKYVLKVLKPEVKKNPNDVPVGIFPDSVNLGQPVWEHPENVRVSILKKIHGEPHSTKNWSDVIYDKELKKPVEVTKEMAENYYSSVEKIAGMEQTSFDNLAKSLKVLDSTPKCSGDSIPGFKVDSINPNNLMVSFDKNEMNIIDYFAKSKSTHQNSSTDITAIISDFALMPEYYDFLSPDKQKALISNIKTIDNKAVIASEKAGLSTDRTLFKNFINDTSKYFYPQHIVTSEGKTYRREYKQTAQKLLDIIENKK